MNGEKQNGLFDKLQPRSLDVAGGDLIGVLKSLKARGAHVSGMVSKGVSGWRLAIQWAALITSSTHRK